MDAPAAFIASLRARGFSLRADGDALYVDPRGDLTPDEVTRIRAEKAALLALLNAPKPMPALLDDSLRIGFDCDPLFQWWKPEGQSLAQTLADLDAPADVVKRYLGKSDAPLHAALGVQDCKGKNGGMVTISGLEFCTECEWYFEAPVLNEAEQYSQQLKMELGF